jgi:hypothetical protein
MEKKLLAFGCWLEKGEKGRKGLKGGKGGIRGSEDQGEKLLGDGCWVARCLLFLVCCLLFVVRFSGWWLGVG